MADQNRPLSPPIHQSAGWIFDDIEHADAIYSGARDGVSYGSLGAPNQRALEQELARLEGAAAVQVTASGMAALSAVLMTYLNPGARVIAATELFGPTMALLRQLSAWCVETTFVDSTDLDLLARQAHGAKMMLIETLSNPWMRVSDLDAVARIAHDHDCLLVVDNTLATPVVCRPLEHGADIVVESVTKFLSGHSDVILGCAAGSDEVIGPIRQTVQLGGLAAAAQSAWLASRGLQSAALRIARACDNAMALARWLNDRPEVLAVHYSAWPTHPDAETAARLFPASQSPILAFELAESSVDRFISSLTHIRLTSSFGTTATTLTHPASMTHRSLSPEERERYGLHRGFLRLSPGIEPTDMLLSDLDQALSS